jgi:hypothetical protein
VLGLVTTNTYLTSYRRGSPVSEHVNVLERTQKYGHMSRGGPKLRMTVLTKASIKILLCSESSKKESSIISSKKAHFKTYRCLGKKNMVVCPEVARN